MKPTQDTQINLRKILLETISSTNYNEQHDHIINCPANDIMTAMELACIKIIQLAVANAQTKQGWYQSNDAPDGFAYDMIDEKSITKVLKLIQKQ